MLRWELPGKDQGPEAGSPHTVWLGMPCIDLNCDIGEGMDSDAAIFPLISSANIACGAHAGDADTMRRSVELALRHQVAIGGHPSYPDRENFGRIDLLGETLRPEELPEILFGQLNLLQQICSEMGTRLHHIKPHGALYNRAAKDAAISGLICQALQQFDASLLLYGLSGSEMQRQAGVYGLSFVSEVFADRTYREDGTLTPRTEAHALIEDPVLAIRQVLMMVREGKVIATTGKEIPLAAATVCLHGDGSHALDFARLIRERLLENGIGVRAPF